MLSYLVPSAAETIDYELDRVNAPSPTNPLGVKGVGETGTIAAAPAVINAVLDALSYLGVHDIQMPATPERVWRAIPPSRTATMTASATAPRSTPTRRIQFMPTPTVTS